jgi:hypothetical protein
MNDQLSAVMGDNRTYIQGLQARELVWRTLAAAVVTLVEQWNGRDGLVTGVEVTGEVDALTPVQPGARLGYM